MIWRVVRTKIIETVLLTTVRERRARALAEKLRGHLKRIHLYRDDTCVTSYTGPGEYRESSWKQKPEHQ